MLIIDTEAQGNPPPPTQSTNEQAGHLRRSQEQRLEARPAPQLPTDRVVTLGTPTFPAASMSRTGASQRVMKPMQSLLITREPEAGPGSQESPH